MRGNLKYHFFLLFLLPPLFLLLPFLPFPSLSLSVPSSIIPLHQLPPVQTLLLPHHTEPSPCVVAYLCFPLPLSFPTLSFLSPNGRFPLPNGHFLPPSFFPFLSFLSLSDVFPSWLLFSCGRR